ncbi:MAG: GNAT family N-acetyltransferase [Pseudomonadota bacterium]
MAVVSLPLQRQKQADGHASTPCIGALQTSAGMVRLTIIRDFGSIESQWRRLQEDGVCAQAQTYERAEAWFRLVSAPSGAEPAIVCGHADSGELQFIWPFEVIETYGIRCLNWIGAEQSNYNMGGFDRTFALSVSAEDMRALLNHAAQLVGANAARFDKQPIERDGIRNPMALLPNRPSANDGHAVLLDQDFDTLYRNRFGGKSRNTLRRKERRLREDWDVTIGWAQTAEERRSLVEEFFRQKARQFAEQGIANVFSDGPSRAFYHELASGPTGRDGTLEVGYLKADDEYAAISCGIFFKDRFTTLLTSIHDGPMRKFSPGVILQHRQIEDCCRKGLNFFDMGAGDARHKSEWCDVSTPLFQSNIAFDERGYILTAPAALMTAAKRFIKTRPALWAFAQRARRTLYGTSDH